MNTPWKAWRPQVALLLGNRIEFVVTLFAAARLGAIAVPLSTREQTPGLSFLLQHCGAVLLMYEAQRAPILPPPAPLAAPHQRLQPG